MVCFCARSPWIRILQSFIFGGTQLRRIAIAFAPVLRVCGHIQNSIRALHGVIKFYDGKKQIQIQVSNILEQLNCGNILILIHLRNIFKRGKLRFGVKYLG